MPITKMEWERFYALRTRLFELIQAVDDGYHKPYEGAMGLLLGFDNVFESSGPADRPVIYTLEVHCYLLINGRHETYSGNTFNECLDDLENDLKEWEQEWEDELTEYRERKKQP